MGKKGNLLGIVAALLYSVVLVGCGPAAAPKVLNIGWTGNPDSLNPGVGLSSDV